jgi:outer membrane receptor protein involved in Fe transport
VDYALDVLPSRQRVDLSASWADLSDKWNVRLFVDNVTDDDPLRNLSNATEANNWRMTGSTLYPRFYGIDVKYRFTM